MGLCIVGCGMGGIYALHMQLQGRVASFFLSITFLLVLIITPVEEWILEFGGR